MKRLFIALAVLVSGCLWFEASSSDEVDPECNDPADAGADVAPDVPPFPPPDPTGTACQQLPDGGCV